MTENDIKSSKPTPVSNYLENKKHAKDERRNPQKRKANWNQVYEINTTIETFLNQIDYHLNILNRMPVEIKNHLPNDFEKYFNDLANDLETFNNRKKGIMYTVNHTDPGFQGFVKENNFTNYLEIHGNLLELSKDITNTTSPAMAKISEYIQSASAVCKEHLKKTETANEVSN